MGQKRSEFDADILEWVSGQTLEAVVRLCFVVLGKFGIEKLLARK
jgi:hypothetical protein